MRSIFYKRLLLLHTLKQRLNAETGKEETRKQGDSPEANHDKSDLAFMFLTGLL